MNGSDGAPLSRALDRLEAEEEGATVGEILDDVGSTSLAFTLLVPAAVVVTPLSGIPGLSSLCGIAIALAAAQMLAGRRHVWLPRFIRDRRLSTERRNQAIEWSRRPLGWLDRATRPRLERLLRRPFIAFLQVATLLCGAAMPLLELVPFTSSILGAAVALLSVAMIARDGLLALAGLVVIAGAVATVLSFVFG